MPRARYVQGHPNHSHRTSRLWQHISNKTVRGNEIHERGHPPARTGPIVVRAEDNALQTVRPASHVQCSSELRGAQPGLFGPPRADGLLAALPSHSTKKASCSQGSLSPSSL
eukprot:scaffold16680_cov66-Phaeocystis_antarctica.AAC.1